MIIARLQGGLGNQMFEYAFGRSLALTHATDLALDLSHYAEDPQRHYALDAFRIEAHIATPAEIARLVGKNSVTKKLKRLFSTRVVHEPHFAFYAPALEADDPCYLDGYWQSENYFAKHAPAIRSELTLIHPFGEVARAFEARMSDTSVSVHVRRGDYAGSQFALCSPEYYQAAIARITEHVPSPHFFMFSDDVTWVRTHLNLPNSTIVSGHTLSDTEELILMSRCRHHIIANSSYSWWGAWLDNRPNTAVIAPKRWFVADVHNTTDLLPSHWLTI